MDFEVYKCHFNSTNKNMPFSIHSWILTAGVNTAYGLQVLVLSNYNPTTYSVFRDKKGVAFSTKHGCELSMRAIWYFQIYWILSTLSDFTTHETRCVDWPMLSQEKPGKSSPNCQWRNAETYTKAKHPYTYYKIKTYIERASEVRQISFPKETVE